MAFIPPIRPGMPFTDRMGSLTREAYQFMFALYNRAGAEAGSLDATTLDKGTWASPKPIGSSFPSTGNFTTLQGNLLSITGGVVANGIGLKHTRVTTGSVPASGSVLVSVPWTTPFVDANYTVTASVVDSTTATASLRVVHVESVTDLAVTVRVENTSASAKTGTLHIIAMHD